jgi:hypothetical protein
MGGFFYLTLSDIVSSYLNPQNKKGRAQSGFALDNTLVIGIQPVATHTYKSSLGASTFILPYSKDSSQSPIGG